MARGVVEGRRDCCGQLGREEAGGGSGRAALAVRIYGERETGVDGGWFLGSRWNFLGLFNYALTNFFILEF